MLAILPQPFPRRTAAALRILPGGPAESYAASGQLAGSFGEAASVTRATTKTLLNPSGTLVTVGSGLPAVGLQGLLIESQHTNICQRSQEFTNAFWNVLGNTLNPLIAADTQVAPDGTTTADTLTSQQNVTVGGSTYSIIRPTSAITVSAGQFYTFSVWIKKTGTVSANPKIYINDGITAAGTGATTCAITTEWQRFSTTLQVGASTSAYPTIGWFDQAATVTGQQIHIWGAQLELARYARSYVATTNASATGNKDVVTFSAAKLPFAACSVSLRFTPLWSTSPVIELWETRVADGVGATAYIDSDNKIYLLTKNNGGSSTTTGTTNALTWTAGTSYLIETIWRNGNHYIYRDGVLVGSVTAGTAHMPNEAATTLRIGVNFLDAGPADGYFSDLRFMQPVP